MWALDLLGPWHGPASFAENRVRICSGFDGHCNCAKEGDEASDRESFSSHVSAREVAPEVVTCM